MAQTVFHICTCSTICWLFSRAMFGEERERAPVKHWVTEVCCWPVAPWLVTSTDIHRWRLVLRAVHKLQNGIEMVWEHSGEADCGSAGAGWDWWGETQKDPVSLFLADVSDKHGCTSRCSIPQKIEFNKPTFSVLPSLLQCEYGYLIE